MFLAALKKPMNQDVPTVVINYTSYPTNIIVKIGTAQDTYVLNRKLLALEDKCPQCGGYLLLNLKNGSTSCRNTCCKQFDKTNNGNSSAKGFV